MKMYLFHFSTLKVVDNPQRKSSMLRHHQRLNINRIKLELCFILSLFYRKKIFLFTEKKLSVVQEEEKDPDSNNYPSRAYN